MELAENIADVALDGLFCDDELVGASGSLEVGLEDQRLLRRDRVIGHQQNVELVGSAPAAGHLGAHDDKGLFAGSDDRGTHNRGRGSTAGDYLDAERFDDVEVGVTGIAEGVAVFGPGVEPDDAEIDLGLAELGAWQSGGLGGGVGKDLRVGGRPGRRGGGSSGRAAGHDEKHKRQKRRNER